MKKTTAFFAMIVAAGMSFAAFADSLSDAKKSGLIGERLDGYLGVVSTHPTPDITALVNDVNARRKAEYQRIAEKNAQALSVVEKLAAAKAIEKTLPGNYVMNANGAWVKK